jgi:DinB family protein
MTNGAPARQALPPLSPEDHVCDACAFDFAAIDVPDALAAITSLPLQVRSAVAVASDIALRRRPAPDVWSAMEYVCHLRDVYATYTIRLHRVRTEDSPAVEPMFSDLRAIRFRYAQLPLLPVLDELESHIAGFRDEAATLAPQDWRRTVSRRPEELRTARWLVRQALHEGRHHLADIREVLQSADSG